jgi:hypothetical protein
MTSPVLVGEIVKKDAINRAVRTLIQGILTDILVAVGLVLVAASTSIVWTSEWWLGLAVLLGKTIVTSVISYVARFLTTPKTA